jgi:hypothetical protein
MVLYEIVDAGEHDGGKADRICANALNSCVHAYTANSIKEVQVEMGACPEDPVGG